MADISLTTQEVSRDLAVQEASAEAAAPADRPYLAKALVLIVDLVAVSLAMALAGFLHQAFRGWDLPGHPSRHTVFGLLSLPIWAACFSHRRLYTARQVTSGIDEFRRVVSAVGLSVMLLTMTSVVFERYVARSWLALTFVFGIVAVAAERQVVRRTFASLRARGRFLRPVIIAGANNEAVMLCAQMLACPGLGYRPVGFVDDEAPVDSPLVAGVRVLGTTHQVIELVDVTGATGVVVATTAISTVASNRLARELLHAGVHVELTSSLEDLSAKRLSVRPLGRHPVVYVEPARRGRWHDAAKRAFDLVVTGAAVAITAPVMAVVAIAIKVDSRGPVLFKQVRVGRDGRLFKVWKFRTMVDRAEDMVLDLRELNESDGPLFKMRDDPRVTRVGRVLRRFSLDELPQFWNVLQGRMSLVGPRPALPSEMLAWTPELHNRLRVKPGLTGMWQVSGRSDCTFAEYVRLDLYYVDNWSLWSDLAIMAKTIPTLLFRRGAY